MKKFLITCLVFGGLFFLYDKIFLVIRAVAPEHDWETRLYDVFQGKIDHELIVIGSSRGGINVDTKLLEDSLGIETYNLSYGGSEVELHEFILKSQIESGNIPKYVIKVLDDDFELIVHEHNEFRVDRLEPLTTIPAVRKKLAEKGYKNELAEELFVLHSMYRSHFDLRTPPKPSKEKREYGNELLDKQIPNLDWTFPEHDDHYDVANETKLEHLLNFQEMCLDNDITLIYTVPPTYKYVNEGWLDRMKELMAPESYFYLYDTTDVRFMNKDYFRDRYHLQRNGASLYTAGLMRYIRDEVIE